MLKLGITEEPDQQQQQMLQVSPAQMHVVDPLEGYCRWVGGGWWVPFPGALALPGRACVAYLCNHATSPCLSAS